MAGDTMGFSLLDDKPNTYASGVFSVAGFKTIASLYWGFSSSRPLNASHSQSLNSVCSLLFCLCRICFQDKNHYFKLCTSILINAGLTESNQSRQLHVLHLGFRYKTVVSYYQTPQRSLRSPSSFPVLTWPSYASCHTVIGHGTCDGWAIRVFWSTWLIDYLEERPFLYKDYRHKGVCLIAAPRKWVRLDPCSTWDYIIVWVLLLL